MNTFTHILASINWIDVFMLVLFIRIVFIGVKTGFVTELFKLFGILFASVESLQRQMFTSMSCKLALKAAPSTYRFLYNNLIGKICTQEKFNQEVVNVISHTGVSQKRF